MKTIFNSNCIVTLTTVEHILRSHNIDVRRIGEHMSAAFGNSFALMPVSLIVKDDDYNDAARILRTEHFTPSCDEKPPSFFKP